RRLRLRLRRGAGEESLRSFDRRSAILDGEIDQSATQRARDDVEAREALDRLAAELAAVPAGNRQRHVVGGHPRAPPTAYAARIARQVRLAQFALEQLAAGIARQRIDEVDGARTLVAGELVAAPGDQCLAGQRGARALDHHRLDALAPARVRHADDRDLDDVR